MSKLSSRNNRDTIGLSHFLPGIGGYTSPTSPRVFDFSNDDELRNFEISRRLGSPSHWRIYFSFDLPSYALPDDSLEAFKKLLIESPRESAEFLRELGDRAHEQRGYYLSVLLERLYDDKDKLSAQAKHGLVSAFAEMMDEVPESVDEAFNFSGAWRRAATFFDKDVSSQFLELVRSAPSINWLATVVRDQGFARGLPEGNSIYAEKQWLNDAQFDNVRSSILARFRNMGLRGVLALPRPIHALYCWLQLGPPGELRELIRLETSESTVFLDFVAALRTWVNSSDTGLQRRLGKENVANFVDPVLVKQRLQELSKVEVADIGARAQEYLQQLEDR